MRAATNPRPVNALLDAAEGLVSAGQQALLDRVELIRSEATEDVRQMLVSVAAISLSLIVGGFGWVMLAVALTQLLSSFMHPALATALVGAPHLIAGIVLARFAVLHLKRNEWALGGQRHLTIEATDA